jgi:hypothetical protein
MPMHPPSHPVHFCCNRFEVSSARLSRRLPYRLSHHACTTIDFAIAVTVVSHKVD